MLSHRLDLFGHGPQKGAQFTGNGSVYHLSGFAFGRQSSEAGAQPKLGFPGNPADPFRHVLLPLKQ